MNAIRSFRYRKIFGYFNYYTVLGVPAGLGAFITSWALTERAVYHYAHGLSTIVSIKAST